ncbi:MAG: NTP transferase domain-containing protein [Termitinemataceae bacterium]
MNDHSEKINTLPLSYSNGNRANDEIEGPMDCIICAAGSSRRMHEWKLSLPWFHDVLPTMIRQIIPPDTYEPWLIDAAVCSALTAGCRVILVTGCWGDELAKRFSGWPRLVVVRNPAWEAGMVASIQAGLTELRSPWFFITHGDMPMIDPRWYHWLIESIPPTLQQGRPLAVRPLYRGVPGHPVLFSQSVVPFIQQIPDGESLKALFTKCDFVTKETEDPSVQTDVDTLETYIRALINTRNSVPLRNSSLNSRAKTVSVSPSSPSVTLITGLPGAGKTSVLRRKAFKSFIAMLETSPHSRSLFILISQVPVGIREAGRAQGFDLEAFYYTSGGTTNTFTQALCRTDDHWGAEPIKLGRYNVNPMVFTELATWLEPAFLEPYEAIHLFIDEIGILEMDRHQGLWPFFSKVVDTRKLSGVHEVKLTCTVRYDRSERLAEYVRAQGYVVQTVVVSGDM